jgi:Fe-Mn family superoxide dismutase
VRNNGGGHANQTVFWETMAPDGGGDPAGPLGDAIQAALGHAAELRPPFNEAAAGRFGSGWAWLIQDGIELAVTSTATRTLRS